MSISPEISVLIKQLNQELADIEQEATEGLKLVRGKLSLFPDNAILIQFLAYLNNGLFFVESYRRRIQVMVEQMSVTEVNQEDIQEVGEELATMLGVILEVKIEARQIVNRLRN